MDENNNPKKYAYLDQLSTEELKELLRADVELPESGNEGAILYILEVIDRREKEDPAAPAFDVKAAWEEFQKYYNIPEGDGLSLYPTSDPEDEPDSFSKTRSIEEPPETLNPQGHRRKKALAKWFVPFAAAFIILLGGMITAQAAGWDILGTLLRWTDETFHLGPGQNVNSSHDNDAMLHDVLQDALGELEITEDLAPTWYPDGCAILSGPDVVDSDSFCRIMCEYSVGEDTAFTINICKYSSSQELDSFVGERTRDVREYYLAGNKLFCIVSNYEYLMAIWSDDETLAMLVRGNIADSDLKKILDSIGA